MVTRLGVMVVMVAAEEVVKAETAAVRAVCLGAMVEGWGAMMGVGWAVMVAEMLQLQLEPPSFELWWEIVLVLEDRSLLQPLVLAP